MARVLAPRRAVPTPVRAQAALVTVLLTLAAAGWLATGDRMAGMDAGPGTDPGSVGFFMVGWVVMMAAMMFPSTWPMAIVFHRVQARRHGVRGATAVFVGGYLLAWTAFGLVAWAVFELIQSASFDVLSWDRAGRWLAVAVLALAAVYQLTPLKDACLKRCRSPFSLVIDGFKPGWGAALGLGARHGAWCVGCCWGLMAALFALGVMSVPWMVFVAAVIAAEKLLPWRLQISLAVSAVLAALAIGIAASPDDVPGLTIPGSGEPMTSMTMEG